MSNDAKETIAASTAKVVPAATDVVSPSAAILSTTEAAPASAAVQSPFCGSLRSKKFFMLDRLASSADDYLDAANHVWCCETQEVIGPDNRRVDPNACGPGRACYSSAVKGV